MGSPREQRIDTGGKGYFGMDIESSCSLSIMIFGQQEFKMMEATLVQ